MPKVTVNSIGEYIREQREQAKISMRQLAQSAGVSNPYLSQIERGLRKPSADILQQIAKGLRISAEALYVQAGILEDREPDTGVRSALLADPQLSERQKQVLLEIYESFRRENANAEAEAAADPAELDEGAPGAEGQALEAEAEVMEAAAWQAAAAEAAEEDARQDARAAAAAAAHDAAAHDAAAHDAAAEPGAAAEPRAAAAPATDPENVTPTRPSSAPDPDQAVPPIR